MPQLDRLLSVMVSSRADSLRLVEGDIAKLEVQGTAKPLTKTPLTSQQLVGLLREVSPAESQRSLDAGEEASFPYQSEDGSFLVRARRHEGRWHADVRMAPDGHAHFTPPIAASPSAERVPLVTMAAAMPAIPAAEPAPPAGAAPIAVESAGAAAADRLLRLMVSQGSSDLHLRVGEPPILRRSGEMERIAGEPVFRADDLLSLVLSIMPEKNREEFAECNDTDFAYEITGCARFRANVLKDRLGVAAVFRQIPAKVVTVEEMGITPEVQKLCYLTKGLVLVTGPTGSGKSTTLCALIDLVNRERSDHIITIEDPIEFVHPNKKCIITQRQVGVHTKSFKAALRAALREDPDIILVGELRDLETVAIAIETAETGHLVFGTLHTTTAASTVDRIIDQFPADRQAQVRTMLSESLKGVISQTLLKKNGGGRVAAREILLSTPALSNLIREGKTHQIPSVMQTSRGKGMVTLNDALLDLVDQKLVDPKEAWMKAVDKPPFVAALKTRGVDTAFADIHRD